MKRRENEMSLRESFVITELHANRRQALQPDSNILLYIGFLSLPTLSLIRDKTIQHSVSLPFPSRRHSLESRLKILLFVFKHPSP